MADQKKISCPQALGAALAGGTAATLGGATHAETVNAQTAWGLEADIVCVGSGAASLAAASTAAAGGASVIVLEKSAVLGGTTAKSGAVIWIPNHFGLKARGISDSREACIQFLSRYAFPTLYAPDAPYFGLSAFDYERIAAFYDNGSKAVDFFRAEGILQLAEWRMWGLDQPAVDYLEHVPENMTPTGRPLAAVDEEGTFCWGIGMVLQMVAFLRKRKVSILIEHAVKELLTDATGAVIGVLVETPDGLQRIRGRQAVIVATGGYAHNTDMIQRYQEVFAYGSCAMPSSQGDFIPLAGRVGAQMGNLHGAWRCGVVLEQALENRSVGTGLFVPPGDSILLVNRFGQRFVNEHRNYNDRSRSHATFDPNRVEFPNKFQFMVYDQRIVETVGEQNGQPPIKPAESYVISGKTLPDLARNIVARVEVLAPRLGGYELDPSFVRNLESTVQRFNQYAVEGYDPEFGRGELPYDNAWQQLWALPAYTETHPANPYPNLSLHPLAADGPYYAIILAPGLLDTNGGPLTDPSARVVDEDLKPIPGLYGAGNCICAPTRNAYAGAGGTLGPALTYGYIAGHHALTRTVAAAAGRTV